MFTNSIENFFFEIRFKIRMFLTFLSISELLKCSNYWNKIATIKKTPKTPQRNNSKMTSWIVISFQIIHEIKKKVFWGIYTLMIEIKVLQAFIFRNIILLLKCLWVILLEKVFWKSIMKMRSICIAKI